MATQLVPVDGLDGANDDTAQVASPLEMIAQLAQSRDDLTPLLSEQQLTEIGHDVIRDYEQDCSDREEWEKGAREGLKRAAQEKIEAKDAPAYRRSFVNYPLLTVAAQQFNARAYPAICKSGNIVRIKVIGSDKGRPQIDPQSGQPLVSINGQPMTMQQAQQEMAAFQAQQPPQDPNNPQPQAQPPQVAPLWQIAPGAKQKRADRVSDYMNIYIEYRMDSWEEDTDDLLNQIPIVGCGFRKLWWHDGKQCAAYVSALDLVVPFNAKTIEDAPRVTEKMCDVFPFQIKQRMASGEYRTVNLPPIGEDKEAPRLLLEQHRYLDLDEDGVDEPYIVTVDHETQEVLRVVSNFGVDDVHVNEAGEVIRIDKGRYYIKYPFLPPFKGGFYNMGFGHLLEQLTDIVNTCINQTFDAGFAQIAGGGFIASGLRLQGSNRDETMRWMPGEYKTVNVSGGDLRAGIVERTFPNPSPIIMQLLELVLGAAKDITSVKDVMTGEANNQAPVGTTLALIEQGLSVFTAIYKRIYRSLGQEFALIYDNLGNYGGEEVAEDYDNVLDESDADFSKDFSEKDMDIKPVADPASVTKMQQLAKAQLLDSMRGKGLNDMEINRRVLEAAGIEDIDELLPQGAPAPDPLMLAKVYQTQTAGDLNRARAAQASSTATKTAVDVGRSLGEANAGGGNIGGIGGLEAAAGNSMGDGGASSQGGANEGSVGAGVVGPGGF